MSDDTPFLNDLSLSDLKDISGVLRSLLRAGQALEERDIFPRFSLVPGQCATMVIDFTMPEIWRLPTDAQRPVIIGIDLASGQDFSAEYEIRASADPAVEPVRFLHENPPLDIAQIIEDMGGGWNTELDAYLLRAQAARPWLTLIGVAEAVVEELHAPDMSVRAVLARLTWLHDPRCQEARIAAFANDLSEFPAPAPQEAAPGIGGEGLAVALPADPPADPLRPGAFVDNAPDQPTPTSQPGSASAMAAARPDAWTAEQDDAAVGIYINAISTGLSITAAGRKVSEALGRPLPGTSFRLRNKLAERIKTELDRLKIEKFQQTIAAAQSPQAAPADAPPVEPAPSADAPAPPTSDDPLTLHLMSLPEKGGWSADRDFDLARLTVESGWPLSDVALDLGMDSKATKDRWDLLTGLHEDPKTGSKVRRFKGRDVLAALQKIVGA